MVVAISVLFYLGQLSIVGLTFHQLNKANVRCFCRGSKTSDMFFKEFFTT